MTAAEAMRSAGSAERAAALSKHHATRGCEAIDALEFGKAFQFFKKAGVFAAGLGILQAEFNKNAHRTGAPTSPFEKKPKIKRCSSCKEAKPDVKFRRDPYEEEVNGESVYRNLCDDCEKQIAQGI